MRILKCPIIVPRVRGRADLKNVYKKGNPFGLNEPSLFYVLFSCWAYIVLGCFLNFSEINLTKITRKPINQFGLGAQTQILYFHNNPIILTRCYVCQTSRNTLTGYDPDEDSHLWILISLIKENTMHIPQMVLDMINLWGTTNV